MDKVDRKTRSRIMAAVKSKNTAAEVDIRRRIFRLGFRYRLHDSHLPGKPDIVFPRHRTAIFINGCFWHNHDCRNGALPKTRREWWKIKLEGNRKRDKAVLSRLHQAGWRTIVIWECSFRGTSGGRPAILDKIAKRIGIFLISQKTHTTITGPRNRKIRTSSVRG